MRERAHEKSWQNVCVFHHIHLYIHARLSQATFPARAVYLSKRKVISNTEGSSLSAKRIYFFHAAILLRETCIYGKHSSCILCDFNKCAIPFRIR